MTRNRPRTNPPLNPVDVDNRMEIPEHSHEMPRTTQRAIIGAIVLFALVLADMGYLQYRDNQRQNETSVFLTDRGKQRDEQNARLAQSIDEAVCQFLNRLPAGPLWDPMREQYGCGPGIPAGEYPAATTAVTPEQFYSVFPQTRNYNN